MTVAVDVLPVCLHGFGLKVTTLSTARHLKGEKGYRHLIERRTLNYYVCKKARTGISLALFLGRYGLRDLRANLL